MELLGIFNPETGVVFDTIGRPISNVAVQVVGVTGIAFDTATTDMFGLFKFARGNLCPTAYDLVVDSPNLAARRQFRRVARARVYVDGDACQKSRH